MEEIIHETIFPNVNTHGILEKHIVDYINYPRLMLKDYYGDIILAGKDHKNKISNAERVSTPKLITWEIVTKKTIPIPSLNKDSPFMVASISFGMFDFFRMPITAIGSVGETKAPNNKQ